MKRARRPIVSGAERGFTLIAVLLILAVLLGGLLAVLHDAGIGMREFGSARSKEMVAGAMEYGLSEAMDVLQTTDPTQLIDMLGDPTQDRDIFTSWGNNSFICRNPAVLCTSRASYPYPPPGSGSPYAGELAVRVGLKLGQRTRAPAGEDVNSAYGYIVEVELAVSRANSPADAAERTTVGVRIPHVYSHN